ncbi:Type III restriction enzyme, res subunit [Lachnospiraceae bacterium RM5]|nr:Type III restriction enzyme, res subunit [Lachnospiraceae bacterium RM5]
MSVEPRYYQKECAEKVYNLVCNGKRRITILVPTGAGKTMISVLIAAKLHTYYQKAFIVAERQEIVGSCNDMIREMGVESVQCITMERLIVEKLNAELCILYSLRPTARKKITEYLGENNSSIVVSLGEPHFDRTEAKPDNVYKTECFDVNIEVNETSNSLERLTAYYKKLGNIQPLVYSTESIIDIRDIMTATPQEKGILSEKLKNDRNILANDISQLSYVATSSNDTELLEMITKQGRKLRYYEQLLASCGISKATLDEEFEKIESLRNKLKDAFYNSDGLINESVMAQFETAVAESVVRITRHVLTLENRDRYEDVLKELMSEDVWKNKLSDESRSYLITAKMNYESMLQMENIKELDFSGVCLLVTKALDVEMSRRLYTSYIDYLDGRYRRPGSIREWPGSMLNKEQSDVLEAKDFTLGSVRFVVGVDKEGNVKNRYVYSLFMDFAKDELYKQSINAFDRETKVKNMVSYVEKIRVDYRNPSAHRNTMDFVTAEACMDYMLETYKKMKEILEDMRR